MTYYSKFGAFVSFVDSQVKTINNSFSLDNYTIHFPYPCQNSDDCTPYKVRLNPGAYHFALCGGNGGVPSSYQKTERKSHDFPYAAGCSSGSILINRITTLYVTVGGHGTHGLNNQNRVAGGYNGGGKSGTSNDCSGGGGATDIRAEEDDVFHRIIVAGGGGGGDDCSNIETNDGRGGSGGGLFAQGYFVNNVLSTYPIANQTFGFSFGHGEDFKAGKSNHPQGSSITTSVIGHDSGGAGGGWFGGFASMSYNGGGSGGSSFALTENAVIPPGDITEYDGSYSPLKTAKYAFAKNRKYLFRSVKHERGVWFGNGYAEITFLGINKCSVNVKKYMNNNIVLLSIILLVK